jgi:predicted ATPase
MDKAMASLPCCSAVYLTHVAIDGSRFPTRDVYPFNLCLLQQTDSISLESPVTFFVGENGTGKSTLLRAIALRCGIHIWENDGRPTPRPNPYAQRLWECLDVRWRDQPAPGSFFAAESFRNFAELVDAWAASDPGLLDYFGGGSLAGRSHGQCNMAFFESRFRIAGIYFLDEPESALSPRRQLELLRILGDASREGRAQFIVATHSPILLSLTGSRILSFDRCPIAPVAYHDTDAYRLHRDFFHTA